MSPELEWYREMAELFGRDVPDSDGNGKRYENMLSADTSARLAAHFGRLALGETELSQLELLASAMKKVLSKELLALIEAECGRALVRPYLIGAADPLGEMSLAAVKAKLERGEA